MSRPPAGVYGMGSGSVSLPVFGYRFFGSGGFPVGITPGEPVAIRGSTLLMVVAGNAATRAKDEAPMAASTERYIIV